MKKLLSIAGLALTSLALTPLVTAKASTITVKQGDTLWDYSNEYHVPLQNILKENNIQLDKYVMWPGDTINIPDGKANTGSFTNHFVFQSSNPISTYVQQAAPTTSNNTSSQASSSVQSSTNNQQPAESSTSELQSSPIGRTMSVTFYDPAVLGATTMPGGLYSGVAANLSVYPKGTVLKITLPGGNSIIRTVNDTGSFAVNPNQLDIATPSSAIPSYGRGTATVEVIK